MFHENDHSDFDPGPNPSRSTFTPNTSRAILITGKNNNSRGVVTLNADAHTPMTRKIGTRRSIRSGLSCFKAGSLSAGGRTRSEICFVHSKRRPILKAPPTVGKH
jgi:hypothetical protein